MSTFNHLFNQHEQICYVQCGFCTTILLVSVPRSSLSMAVTVRCGHCTSLLSVNMARAPHIPLNLFTSLNQAEPKQEAFLEEADAPKVFDKHSSALVISSEDEDEDALVNPVFNKPPEKRQRAPSAYNCFIKDEIRRLKTMHPNIAHKQAFGMAAKNWAHFPSNQRKGHGENSSQGERDADEG